MDSYNILIVDYELGILSALKRTFRHDYNIFSATNGKDALNIMEQNDIALILTDHRIPGMNGIELLRKALQEYPETARIILTTYLDQDLLTDAVNMAHIHSYLLKPWETEEIKAIVREGVETHCRYLSGCRE